jgi:hypothetical protein
LDNATHGRLGDLVLPLILLAFLLLGGRFLSNADVGGTVKAAAFVCMVLAVGVILLHSSARRLRFALGVSACLLVPALTPAVTTLMIQRSFFGVHRVLTETEGNARFLTLVHGTTLHGARSLLPGEETLPTTYYSPDGPFGRFLRALPQALQRVAVIGLGTGALSCYAKPGQQWTFY